MKISKVAVIGHGSTCMSSAIAHVLKNKGIEVVSVDEIKGRDRGTNVDHLIIDDLIAKTESEILSLVPFRPPLTRRERRKLNRKK